MGICTFFGHSECYGLEEEKLREAIVDLIEQGIYTFYVGNHGGFDAMVHTCLKQLSKQYPQIHYSVVLAYLPGVKREGEELSDAIYPEGLELGPPRFAIERRNKWMIDKADHCLCYVNFTWGGAYKFVGQAQRCGLTITNLGTVVL